MSAFDADPAEPSGNGNPPDSADQGVSSLAADVGSSHGAIPSGAAAAAGGSQSSAVAEDDSRWLSHGQIVELLAKNAGAADPRIAADERSFRHKLSSFLVLNPLLCICMCLTTAWQLYMNTMRLIWIRICGFRVDWKPNLTYAT